LSDLSDRQARKQVFEIIERIYYVPPATARQCINYCTAFIERFGAEPEQGLIFLQERLHGPVGISRVEHLCRGFGHGHARAAGTGEKSAIQLLL